MIERYTRPAMGRIWSEEAKYQAWLRVELAVCEAYARRGRIPGDALARIRARARVDIARILAIQERVRHEMIALLTSLEEQLGDDARFVHIGLTTNDVWDTATALQLRDAADLLIAGQERLRAALGALALRHKDTLIVGRTHGVHAEPTTFGLKVAVWWAEAGRNLERLGRARTAIAVGKLSGAVGQFAHVEPALEEEVCRGLGLEPAPVSTQIVQRDRHAEFCALLAVAAASLEKIALEVRGLQRTEVLEAQEPFGEGQKGSSAMPHKRNPELSERICGLARLIRANAQAALENVALWHERDISHSSVERVILPDSTIALDYILHLATFVVQGLDVDPARMAENLELSHGLVYSQRVLLELTDRGLARQVAYEIVQKSAMRAWRERRSFLELLAGDPAVTERLAPEELKACFDPAWYLRNVDAVFRRIGLQ
ncbi:MAG: adenylosuccinate lyase [Candidatus Rokubacteria bacterium RIFCSPHIGHO2_12_FULL_73_22]|nr:MAG: adenylosuccinate lyase [Candidatus Rokubacteria bacterium RIFCSPHIGHO2_02_FULL_73_26]OGL01427.1 MAG: adenylosuccinate lyase [Candidatus Rokubacteria bacterium RIFCSPHIGHO2_12_FULL_73_22]OGL07849.1 MAG: adenylosuccinate lyase [Candidatus Rokubacteria bacterium RIFCSPLOWO2_02_FULL_73_56]